MLRITSGVHLSKFNEYIFKMCAFHCTYYLKGEKKLQAIINFRLMIFMLKYLGGSILLSFVYFKMHFLKDRLVEGRIDT